MVGSWTGRVARCSMLPGLLTFNGLLVCLKGQQQCRLQGIQDLRLAADVWQEMVKSDSLPSLGKRW